MAQPQQGEPMPNLPSPLGVHRGYMSPQPTIMVMKERVSFSGDDFTVHTTAGNPVLRVDGKAFSLSQQKKFYSPSNELLFVLKHHKFSLFKSTYLESPGGEVVAELEGRARYVPVFRISDKILRLTLYSSFGKAKIDVSFTNTCVDPPQPVVLEVRGQFFDRSADILVCIRRMTSRNVCPSPDFE